MNLVMYFICNNIGNILQYLLMVMLAPIPSRTHVAYILWYNVIPCKATRNEKKRQGQRGLEKVESRRVFIQPHRKS